MKYLVLASLFAIVSCGHHKDVRPGASGIHRVVVRGEYKESAEEESIRQANHYCKEFEKSAAFVSEKTSYTGDVDEQTYKTGKVLTRVFRTAGSSAHIYGGKKERNAGGIGAIGGVAGDAGLGNGYTSVMTFRCQ